MFCSNHTLERFLEGGPAQVPGLQKGVLGFRFGQAGVAGGGWRQTELGFAREAGGWQSHVNSTGERICVPPSGRNRGIQTLSS